MRGYMRRFVAMQAESPEYSARGRKAMGRCVIERRGEHCKIIINVQDMLPETVYKLYLISVSGGRSVCVLAAGLPVDARGRGEQKLTCDPDDVFGSRLPIEGFDVVALCAEKGNRSLDFALSGFTERPVSWKNDLVFIEKGAPVPEPGETPGAVMEESCPETADAADLPGVTEIEAAPEEPALCQDAEPIETKTPSVPEPETLAEKPEETTAAPEEPAINSNSPKDVQGTEEEAGRYARYLNETHEAFKHIAAKFNDELEALRQRQFNYEGHTEDKTYEELHERRKDLGRIFTENTPISPFSKQKKDIFWVRAKPANLRSLPYDYGRYADNEYITECYNNYNHLLLGRFFTDINVRYIIGVPDTYRADKKQSIMSMGFGQFKCCDGGQPRENAYGYWLLIL